MTIFSLDNEAFVGLVRYGTLVLGKTLFMSLVTSYYRTTKLSVPTLEDARMMAPNDKAKQKEMLRTDEDVERARRCHRNDLENVLPFVLLGLLYVSTGPNASTALWHFKIFFWSRVLHTIAHVGALPQPSRGVAFLAGYLVNASMVARTLLALP